MLGPKTLTLKFFSFAFCIQSLFSPAALAAESKGEGRSQGFNEIYPGYRLLPKQIYRVVVVDSKYAWEILDLLPSVIAEFNKHLGERLRFEPEAQKFDIRARPDKGEIFVRSTTWQSDHIPSWAGVSTLVADHEKGRITGALIELHHRLFEGRFSPDWKTSVLAHELGHALGLAHFEHRVEGQRQLMSKDARGKGPFLGEGDLNGLKLISGSSEPIRQKMFRPLITQIFPRKDEDGKNFTIIRGDALSHASDVYFGEKRAPRLNWYDDVTAEAELPDGADLTKVSIETPIGKSAVFQGHIVMLYAHISSGDPQIEVVGSFVHEIRSVNFGGIVVDSFTHPKPNPKFGTGSFGDMLESFTFSIPRETYRRALAIERATKITIEFANGESLSTCPNFAKSLAKRQVEANQHPGH